MAIQPYLDLITSEYHDKPKFMAWLTVGLQILDDIGTCAESIPDAFSVDNSVGVQQDVVGQIVGASRNIGVQLADGTAVLDDDHFRLLIRAKVAQNQWNGQTPSIYTLWTNIFPNSQLQLIDNQDMTVQGIVTGMDDVTSQEMVNNGLIIPVPMGVQLTIIEQTNLSDTPFVGLIVGGGYDTVNLTTVSA